jgi:alginate O-acetyltransferase complex protein AlgI
MSFNSLAFILVFLPVGVGGYFLLARIENSRWQKLWLLAISTVFFSSGRLHDFLLLLASLTLNCLMAKALLAENRLAAARRRRFLTLAISANILFLCYFKYAGFFLQTFDRLSGFNIPITHSSFPLGISFYTIIQIMFLVDCYEGFVESHNWLDHFAFGGLFAYVTMGPIVRWKQIVPQLNHADERRVNPDNLAAGLFLFVIGLFKKAVLADTFFRWADAGFGSHGLLSLVGGWLTALAFTAELYFDFSGYTDMAIGAALMFNVRLPQNFNAPFRATNIIDFWRRWHITLTNFITTYLYTPMIRSMKHVTFAKAMMATFVAMLIAGFWHGANWTFIVFGALHGGALVLNQCWRKMKWPMPQPLGWLATFTLVVISLVFFRSSSLTQANHLVQSMFTTTGGLFNYEPWQGIDRVDQLIGLAWMVVGAAILFRAPSSLELQRTFKPSWTFVTATIALALIACIYANGVVSRSFVYHGF